MTGNKLFYGEWNSVSNTFSSERCASDGSLPSNSSPSECPNLEWRNDVERIGYTYVMTVICLLSITMNLLILLVLWRKQYKATSFILLKSLAVAETVTAFITCILGLTFCDVCPDTTAGFWRVVYQVYIYYPVSNTSETMSAWITVMLGVERVMVMRSLTSKTRFYSSRKKTHVAIGILALLAMALNCGYFFPLAIDGENQKLYTAFGRSCGFEIYSWIRAALVQFLPLVVLIIVNILLLWCLHLSHKRSRRICIVWSSAARRERAQRDMTIMLLATIAIFICGHVPVAFAYASLYKALGDTHSSTYATYRVITHCIAILSYSTNIVFYCIWNQRFRNDVKDLLYSKRHSAKVADLTMASNMLSAQTNSAVENSQAGHIWSWTTNDHLTKITTVKSLIEGAPDHETKMILTSSCRCLCRIHWSQVLSQEWRCNKVSWSSADRRCSNYTWVINKFIAY